MLVTGKDPSNHLNPHIYTLLSTQQKKLSNEMCLTETKKMSAAIFQPSCPFESYFLLLWFLPLKSVPVSLKRLSSEMLTGPWFSSVIYSSETELWKAGGKIRTIKWQTLNTPRFLRGLGQLCCRLQTNSKIVAKLRTAGSGMRDAFILQKVLGETSVYSPILLSARQNAAWVSHRPQSVDKHPVESNSWASSHTDS